MKELFFPIVETKKGISKGLPKDYKIKHPATSDAMFYNLFSNKNIAARVMSIIENREISPLDIEYKDKDFKHPVYHSTYMDIRFTIEDKLDIDLEMQNERLKLDTLSYEETLIHRLIRYSGNLIVESSKKGDSEYMNRGIHIVCFANFTYNEYEEALITYKIMDKLHNKSFDIFRITVVFIPNLEKANPDLKEWLGLLLTKEPLHFLGRNLVMNEAIDVILSCDDDPSLQEYYRQKEMAEIEEGILLAKAKAEGIAEGRTKGRAEGRTEGIAEGRTKGRAEGRIEGRVEGRVEGRADTIRLMYAGGMTLQGIASLLKTSLDEIKEILGL